MTRAAAKVEPSAQAAVNSTSLMKRSLQRGGMLDKENAHGQPVMQYLESLIAALCDHSWPAAGSRIRV